MLPALDDNGHRTREEATDPDVLRRLAPAVAVVQTTQARVGNHHRLRTRLVFDWPAIRGVLAESIMNTVPVIVRIYTHEPAAEGAAR